MNSYRQSHVGDRYGKRYDTSFAQKVDALVWDNFVKPFVRAELKIAASTGLASYLDFACGTGRLLKVGFQVFGRAVGVDISPDMLVQARSRVPSAELICSDVTRDERPDLGPFACVTMFRFILNAEPELRREVLAWLSRHMADGGVLVVNNHGHAASLRGLVTKLAFWLPSHARNLLSRGETFRILNEAGFSIVRCEGFGVLPALFGRPIFGRWLQTRLERLCMQIGLGRFGSELVVVAKRR